MAIAAEIKVIDRDHQLLADMRSGYISPLIGKKVDIRPDFVSRLAGIDVDSE